MDRLSVLTLPLLASCLLATPAMAQPRSIPATRVVECDGQSCLRITGYRADTSAPVFLNGHEVVVTGKHRWKAHVPVAQVRQWSAPYARSIHVTVAHEDHDTRLPVGLLGTRGDLAMLVVSVK